METPSPVKGANSPFLIDSAKSRSITACRSLASSGAMAASNLDGATGLDSQSEDCLGRFKVAVPALRSVPFRELPSAESIPLQRADTAGISNEQLDPKKTTFAHSMPMIC